MSPPPSPPSLMCRFLFGLFAVQSYSEKQADYTHQSHKRQVSTHCGEFVKGKNSFQVYSGEEVNSYPCLRVCVCVCVGGGGGGLYIGTINDCVCVCVRARSHAHVCFKCKLINYSLSVNYSDQI